MLRFRRPKKPRGFAASVRDAEQRVKAQIKQGGSPEFEKTLWQRHKATFLHAQHDKCGYCEMRSSNHPGSVEHYAPKSQVDELMARGAEEFPGVAVVGRKFIKVCEPGYWWLAYSWDNWLFTCERCNTPWKGCLFPIRERRVGAPRPGLRETQLLLHPFGKVDPIEHLDFDQIGQICPRSASDRGEATIMACGLDRESLRRAREAFAEDAHRYIGRLQAAINRNDFSLAQDAADDLLKQGDESRAHAGMIRAIVLTELGRSWRGLKALRDQLRRRAGRSRRLSRVHITRR